MSPRLWPAICLMSLSGCSTEPEPGCLLPTRLTQPAPPLAAPDALVAPLSAASAFEAWMDDIRLYNDLRDRHAALAAEAERCLKTPTPPEG
jgi:hypothetical protein